jgi:hypothetical protein
MSTPIDSLSRSSNEVISALEREILPRRVTDHSWVTLRGVVAAVLILLASILLSLILPGVIAARNGVFYADTMAPRLPLKARQLMSRHDSVMRTRRAQISALDSVLAARAHLGSTQGASDLVALRLQLRQQVDSARAPVAVIPFYLNPQMVLWPAIYTTLGWLLLLLRPRVRNARRTLAKPWQILALGSTTYVFYQWPLWLRNFVFNNQGRTVYAYPNFDIDRASFFVQELVIAGFCLMLAGVWLQWAQYYAITRRSSYVRHEDPIARALDPGSLARLARLFSEWQVASVVLGCGFIFFTNFFWNLVAGYKDQRYVISALNAHVLWALTWIMISLPLITTWRSWHETRLAAIAELSRTEEKKAETLLKLIQEARPFGQYASGAAALSAVASFLFPLLQLVK